MRRTRRIQNILRREPVALFDGATRDEVAGQHEEEVDADPARPEERVRAHRELVDERDRGGGVVAGERPREVEHQHEEHGEAAHAVEGRDGACLGALQRGLRGRLELGRLRRRVG
jgi:hypothetical protein